MEQSILFENDCLTTCASRDNARVLRPVLGGTKGATPLSLLGHLTALFKSPGLSAIAMGRGITQKMLLAMKLTAILLFAACLQVSAKGDAQTVSISVNNAPLEKVFQEIKKQTGFKFFYEGGLLDNAKKASVTVKNASLEEVLNICFKGQPFTFTIIEKTILIKRKDTTPQKDDANLRNQPPTPIDVHGKIVNEKGEPVIATIMVKGTNKGTTTNDNGEFELKGISDDAVLVISGVSIESFEVKVNGRSELALGAKIKTTQGEEVVINTGYQKMKPNEVTGSIVQIDNQLFNRRVSPDVLSRIDGVANGVYFNGADANSNVNVQLQGTTVATKLGINIRGQSTINTGKVSADPLIVVDNFIYSGSLSNLNPNNIESITILKDAAAASIWGAQSGNGVIVITTKKGKLNQKMKIDFNSNLTVGNKPDLFYSKSFLNSSDYLDAELFLNSKGLFNGAFTSPGQPALSPVVEILGKRRSGLISSSDSASQIDALRNNDVRKDYSNYVYQKSVYQQYALNLSGGGNNIVYNLSIGYDHNKENLVKNWTDRFTINSTSTYYPVKNLELTGGIQIAQSKVNQPNQFSYGSYSMGSSVWGAIYPYARLKDDNGNNLSLVKDYRYAWIDTIQRQGYLNWRYTPLDEISLGENSIDVRDLTLQTSAKYKFTSYLSAQLSFQNEKQAMLGRNYQSVETYAARNYINKFSVKNSNGSFSYKFPVGGMLNSQHRELNSNQFRAQLNFNQTFNNTHNIVAIAGYEVRELKNEGTSFNVYGYNDLNGTFVSNLDYVTAFPTAPLGIQATLPSPGGFINGINNRYISYYSNAAYTYKNLYTFSISGRKDGANIFGVKTNDKISPFWSTGFKWNIEEEKFYSFSLFPHLDLRASYGFNGNVYNGGAYLTGFYNTAVYINAPSVQVSTAPNPQLRWEKVKNINIGLDFAAKNNIVSGSLEWYQKVGQDLIEDAPLAPSTGFPTFRGNAASTSTRGLDINLTSRNIDKKFKWYTTLLLTTVKDRVTKYDQAYQGTSLVSSIGGIALEGKPLYGIFSYRWAGLDPATGDPQGYLNKSVSKNYSAILNNSAPDSLVYNGPARPTAFGAFRNTFSYKGFSFSFNITYSYGFYFRRSSTPLNYLDVLKSPNSDYSLRWQNPGDEKNTNVPSIIYPSNTFRSQFYQYSEVLVDKGDFIRLKDLQLSYTSNANLFKKVAFTYLTLYAYANNLGLLWRANKDGIDPAYYNSIILPSRLYSFGIKAGF